MTTSLQVEVPEWTIGDRVRKALDHAGVGVQEIADYLGVSRGAVSTWINGRIEPRTAALRLIAMRCGVPFEWLRDGEVVRRQGLEPRTRWLRTGYPLIRRQRVVNVVNPDRLAPAALEAA